MRRLVAVILLVPTVVVFLPASAQAQFGGLVKRAIAKRAAEEIIKQPDSGKPGKRGTLTDDQVTRMLAGFTEEARSADEIGRAAVARYGDVMSRIDSYLAKEAAFEKSREDAERQGEAYSACTQGYTETLQKASMAAGESVRPDAMALAQKMEGMNDDERSAFEKKLNALQTRAEAAQKSGNLAEQQRVRADLEKLTGIKMSRSSMPPASTANMERAKAAAAGIQKCEMPSRMAVAERPEPVRVRRVLHGSAGDTLETEANQMISSRDEAAAYVQQVRLMSLGDKPMEQGAAAAGMSKGEYALMREELLYFYAIPVTKGQSPRAGAFGEAELRLLDAHRTELLTATKRLRTAGTLE